MLNIRQFYTTILGGIMPAFNKNAMNGCIEVISGLEDDTSVILV